MRQFFSLTFLFLLLVLAVPAYADIARPNPVPSPPPSRIVLHTSLTVVPDNKAYEARLQISESSLQELRAALGNTPANGSISQGIASSSTRTMIAGVFMFLSVSFAGVWLARSMQTRAQKVVAGLLLCTAVIGARGSNDSSQRRPAEFILLAQIVAESNEGCADFRWRRYRNCSRRRIGAETDRPIEAALSKKKERLHWNELQILIWLAGAELRLRLFLVNWEPEPSPASCFCALACRRC